MLRWLILGLVVALVSHWSSKEVHADSPLSEGEQELLVKLKETLDGSIDVPDKKSFGEDSNPCEEICEDQDEDSYEECLEDCGNAMERRMFQAVVQEEHLERALGSDDGVSKKFVRIPWRAPRIPRIPWRAPRIPRIPWRAPRIPRIPWRAPRIRSPWKK